MFDDFADTHRDFFTTLDDVLEQASADDMAKRGLSAFDEGLADIGDGEGGPMGLVNMVIDDRCEVTKFKNQSRYD